MEYEYYFHLNYEAVLLRPGYVVVVMMRITRVSLPGPRHGPGEIFTGGCGLFMLHPGATLAQSSVVKMMMMMIMQAISILKIYRL